MVKHFLISLLSICAISLSAQMVRVEVAPEKYDWLYKKGEKVKFNIRVVKNDIPIENVTITWKISEDMMAPRTTKTEVLKKGVLTVDAGTMKSAGFLRCQVEAEYEGQKYNQLATAGISPEEIKPTQVDPKDFDAFWAKNLEANKKLPIDGKMVLLPEKCTSTVNVYQVNYQNFQSGSRIYGILCIPKAEGKYPAILTVPGAGVRAYNGDIANAEKGFITLQIGIHGIPVNLPTEVYTELYRGALFAYNQNKLDSKDDYYYKRVYLGCVRSIDFIFTLPQFDGENVGVIGGSQGGALSIVTAALDSRVKAIVSYYPALSDLTGHLHNRAGGWPHLFKDGKNATKERIETTAYYDVVNFARRVKQSGFYSFGYNDMVCPPTSMFSAYNVITAEKTLLIAENTAHWLYTEQRSKSVDWLHKQLKK